MVYILLKTTRCLLLTIKTCQPGHIVDIACVCVYDYESELKSQIDWWCLKYICVYVRELGGGRKRSMIGHNC